ncbi:MAG: tetratricopeptide repeat protein, partial [Thermoanaerobaculia bacterium]
MQALRRKWVLVAAGLPVVIGLFIAGGYLALRAEKEKAELREPSKPEAPPDLEKLRTPFISGIQAVQRGDGRDAIRHLSSFNFGPRSVEEYRLYYLSRAQQLDGNIAASRRTLAQLWARSPKLVHATDAGFSLAGIHLHSGAFRAAATTYQGIASRTDNAAIAGTARWQELEARFITGEIDAMFDAARLITIRSPRAPQAGDAIAVVRTLTATPAPEPLALTPAERLERAVCLMRDGDSRSALTELTALEPDAPPALHLPVALNRGLAMHHLRRLEDSNKVLEPLTGTYYRYAIPALFHLAKNYRIQAGSIDPTVKKTVMEKKRVGTVKVKVGTGKKRRTVSKPKYATVRKTVELVDLAKKEKKENFEKLHSERLRDLLQLPLADAVRLDVLNAIAGIAEEKNQDESLREIIPQVIALDPLADPALQHFWNEAWAAYTRGDFDAAKPRLRFIADTYTSVNVKRQAEYWYARTIERQGQKEEAAAIYQRLASAPYADLYAMHSVSRGAKREEERSNPLRRENRSDWREIAEKEMPSELRLAYELTALSAFGEA